MRNALPIVLVLMSLSGCSNRTQAVQTALAEPSGPSHFDARTFLCELSEQHRWTPNERARARDIIARELVQIGLEPQLHEYQNGRRIYYSEPSHYGAPNMRGVNVYADLPATEPSDEWLVIGAHYDTVSTTPGADDNGSGTTAVLLVARELVQLRHRSLNVMFAFFDQEEDGLVGSDMFVHWLLREEQRRLVALHNIDMVGWDAARDREVTVMIGENPAPRAELDDYIEMYRRAATTLRADTSRTTRPSRILRDVTNRGEHVTFHMHGVLALTIIEDSAEVGDFNPYYHGPQDTCDNIDYDYLRMCADLVTLAVTEQLQ